MKKGLLCFEPPPFPATKEKKGDSKFVRYSRHVKQPRILPFFFHKEDNIHKIIIAHVCQYVKLLSREYV